MPEPRVLCGGRKYITTVCRARRANSYGYQYQQGQNGQQQTQYQRERKQNGLRQNGRAQNNDHGSGAESAIGAGHTEGRTVRRCGHGIGSVLIHAVHRELRHGDCLPFAKSFLLRTIRFPNPAGRLPCVGFSLTAFGSNVNRVYCQNRQNSLRNFLRYDQKHHKARPDSKNQAALRLLQISLCGICVFLAGN